mmetsp:Transcript_39747/g.113332  ORF Transcript_39747/g.113332 Transcript_39747/m.113332 type:complete len:217 (-) Transcript_39747:1677-2327(-)
MRVSRRSARARHTSCFSPTLKLSPASVRLAIRPPVSLLATPSSCTALSAPHTASSECSLKGSRLALSDPAKMTGDCGMIDMLDLSVRSRKLRLSTPSMVTLPPSISDSRNKAAMSDVLPAPDLPTMPIFSLGRRENETPLRAVGMWSRYRSTTSLKATTPSDGHGLGWGSVFFARVKVVCSSAGVTCRSCGRRAYSMMRSTDVMKLVSSADCLAVH